MRRDARQPFAHSTSSITAAIFRDLSFRDIQVASAKRALLIEGLPEAPIRDLRFENISIEAEQGVSAEHVEELELKNVTMVKNGRP